MLEKFAIFCKNMLDWFKSDRCFVSYFIKAFPLANNLLLLTLVLLSIFIISMYMIISAKMSVNPLISFMVIVMLSSALASGYFYTIKTTINQKTSETPEKKIPDIKSALSMFYTGVGEHYLSFIGLFILFFLFASFVVFLTVIAAEKFICHITDIGINIWDFFFVLADPNQIDILMNSITKSQQTALRNWSRLFLITTQTYTFLIMLWVPELLYKKTNVFKAFFGSVKKVIIDFPNALCVYLTIMFLNYILALAIILFAQYSFIGFLLNIGSLYLLSFNFYALFLYYRNKFTDEDRGWVA